MLESSLGYPPRSAPTASWAVQADVKVVAGNLVSIFTENVNSWRPKPEPSRLRNIAESNSTAVAKGGSWAAKDYGGTRHEAKNSGAEEYR